VYNNDTDIIGASSLCGRKDVQPANNEFGYRAHHAFVPIPKSSSDTCNLFHETNNSPNRDLVDSTILILLHELVEATISSQSYDNSTGKYFNPFTNDCDTQTGQSGWAPADVCSHLIPNLVHTGDQRYFNLALNGQKYSVSPVWDNQALRCSLGANPTKLGSNDVTCDCKTWPGGC
jgi:hypothetical protein